MKLQGDYTPRVRILITEIDSKGKPIKGKSKSFIVEETNSIEVNDLIVKSIKQAK